jgi:hypothetical protein
LLSGILLSVILSIVVFAKCHSADSHMLGVTFGIVCWVRFC